MALLVTLASIIVMTNAEVAQRFSYLILLGAAGFSLILSKIFAPQPYSHLIKGVKQCSANIACSANIGIYSNSICNVDAKWSCAYSYSVWY